MPAWWRIVVAASVLGTDPLLLSEHPLRDEWLHAALVTGRFKTWQHRRAAKT